LDKAEIIGGMGMHKYYLIKAEKTGAYGSQYVVERVVDEIELSELIFLGWTIISKEETQ